MNLNLQFAFALIVALVLPSIGAAQSPTQFQQTKQALTDPADKTILIAAHRGGCQNDKQDNAPENTIANISNAINKGFHVFETDIRITIDGVFVIVHDATLERETDGTGSVEKMTSQAVSNLKKKFRDGSLSDHGVATFEAMLATGKDKIFFKPDLKPGVIDSFDQLARLIHDQKMAGQVFLRTEYKHLWKIEKLFSAGTPRVEVMFKVNNAEQVNKVQKLLAPATIQINIKEDEMLSDETVEAIKTAVGHGMLVETHVYNNAEQTEQLIESGVRMFHTGKPELILKYLNDRLSQENPEPNKAAIPATESNSATTADN